MNINDKHLEEVQRDAINTAVPIIKKPKAEWLLQFIQEKKPKTILELGTAIGYSGIILGSEGGYLTTIELSHKEIQKARKYLRKASTTFTIIYGDAVPQTELLVKEGRKFDLLFVDFMNSQYCKVYESCISLVKKGGFIITDNINHDHSKEFKERLILDSRLETEIIEIGDGMSVTKKL